MLTRDDLLDILIAGLARAEPAGFAAGPAKKSPVKPGPAGRTFLSEYEIKKLLTAGGKRLTIPSNSILSPLALDWLTLQGIEIVRK